MRRLRVNPGRVALHVVMFAVALTFVAPIYYLFTMSVQDEDAINQPIPHWIPYGTVTTAQGKSHVIRPTLDNYRELWERTEEAPVARWFLNSVLVATAGTLLALTLSSMAAYAFSRLRFRGRDALFIVVLATLIIPGQVAVIPVYLILQRLGWFNTYWALIVPGLAGAFGVFLLRQFFLTIPTELEEAALIDGCSRAAIYRVVILPLAKPALATLAIFSFLGAWNDFLLPLIAVSETEMRTLPVGLNIFLGRYAIQYGMVMAVAVVASLPVILMFVLFQRHIIKGVVLSGLKG